MDRSEPSRVHTGELVSLTERMASLQILRLILAALAGGWVWLRADVVPVPRADLVLTTAGYLAVVAIAEAARRTKHVGGRALTGTMLLVDGLYLAWAMYATGGSGSPLRFLPLLHLIAVTLAGSYRTGLKIALWHSLLFFVAYYAQAGEVLRTVEATTAAQFTRRAVVTITTLWAVAIVTAAFSSLNERELRRRRRDLEMLTDMSAALDRTNEPKAIAQILLDHVSAAFGFTRGAVLAGPSRRPPVLAKLRTSGAGGRRTKADALVQRAWRERSTILARAADAEADPRISSLLPGAANLLVVPMWAEGQPVATLVLEHAEGRIERRVVVAVERFAAHAALELRSAWLLERVRGLAATDPLTGVANRRTFHDLLERELARARRRADPVTLVMLDLDNFKQINDEHGHQFGDEVLREVAGAIRAACRGSDVAARYGGEEFAVIMPDCSSRESVEAAERLRSAISELDGLAPVAASAGTATFPTHAADATALVRAADEALYESKRRGRDRTTRSRKRGRRRSDNSRALAG